MSTPKAPKRGHQLPYGAGSFYYAAKSDRWVGTLEAGWNTQGNRRRITVSSKDENTAWQKLQAKRKQILAEGIPAEGMGGLVTVGVWAKKYLEIRKDELKPAPWRGERTLVNKWIIPTLGHRKLEELTPADVRALGDAVMTENSSTYARLVQRTFQQYMAAAQAEGFTVPQRVIAARKQSARVSPREAIPLEDVLKILEVAHQHDDHSRWDAAFLQGIRQGEALGLLWENVDLKAGTMTIKWGLHELTKTGGDYAVPDQYEARHLDGRFWLIEPKTAAASRVIPMVPAFRNVLEEWKEKAPASPHGLVWPRDNGMPRIASYDREEFKALQAAAGVSRTDGKPYVPHEIRTSTVSILLELGIPREVIEAIVGHSKLVENYVRVSDERVAAALAALGDTLRIGATQ